MSHPQTTGSFDEDGYGKGEWPRKKFIRRTKINFMGMSAFLIYLAALGFYIWVCGCVSWFPQILTGSDAATQTCSLWLLAQAAMSCLQSHGQTRCCVE